MSNLNLIVFDLLSMEQLTNVPFSTFNITNFGIRSDDLFDRRVFDSLFCCESRNTKKIKNVYVFCLQLLHASTQESTENLQYFQQTALFASLEPHDLHFVGLLLFAHLPL